MFSIDSMSSPWFGLCNRGSGAFCLVGSGTASAYEFVLAAACFSSDTESAHDEKTDKPEKKGFKLSTLYSSLVSKKKETDVEAADKQVRGRCERRLLSDLHRTRK